MKKVMKKVMEQEKAKMKAKVPHSQHHGEDGSDSKVNYTVSKREDIMPMIYQIEKRTKSYLSVSLGSFVRDRVKVTTTWFPESKEVFLSVKVRVMVEITQS